MKKVLNLTVCVGFMCLIGGCACSDYSSLRPFKDRPIRTKVRSWFQGDPCNTCNVPAGQPTNCGTNVAPLCDSCGTNGQPVYSGEVPGVQLYDNPNLNAPMSTPGAIEYPSPIYTDGAQFQNGINSSAYGSGVANGAETPPNF